MVHGYEEGYHGTMQLWFWRTQRLATHFSFYFWDYGCARSPTISLLVSRNYWKSMIVSIFHILPCKIAIYVLVNIFKISIRLWMCFMKRCSATSGHFEALFDCARYILRYGTLSGLSVASMLTIIGEDWTYDATSSSFTAVASIPISTVWSPRSAGAVLLDDAMHSIFRWQRLDYALLYLCWMFVHA